MTLHSVDIGPETIRQFLTRRLIDEMHVAVVPILLRRGSRLVESVDEGWDGFVSPPTNGCLAAMRSFTGGQVPDQYDLPLPEEVPSYRRGLFFPEHVVTWLRSLPVWYEDDHAIYVHAGLPPSEEGFPHPRDVEPQVALLWCRNEQFFRCYRGKTVVFGHTRTEYLPMELSGYTPDDPSDLWAYENVIGIDTGCGNGGFLTALEFPSLNVYESRD